jgi:outer membrane protein OmpA-like peptidoglycan-associated protein
VGLASWWGIRSIENGLVDDTRSALAEQGLTTEQVDALDINFDYRDGTVAGAVPTGFDEGALRTGLTAIDEPDHYDLDTSGLRPGPAPEAPADPERASTDVSVVRAANGSVILSGTVLSEAQRTQLVDAAETTFGAAQVTDQLQVVDLDPAVDGADARVAALAEVVGQLGATTEATATLSDTTLEVGGTANSTDDVAALNELSTDYDFDPFSTSFDVAAPALTLDEEVDALQGELDNLQEEIRRNVTFATNSDVLDAQASETLDKVVAAMDTYRLPVVEVSGHTDDVGDADLNRSLSDRRAQSVRSYLVTNGVGDQRLAALGYGEDQPEVPNNPGDVGTPENRRVEFLALATFDR